MVTYHKVVNHSQKEYANDNIHNNNFKNRNSLLRLFFEIFRGVSKKNLNKYVKIKEFFLNLKLDFYEEFFKMMLSCNDKYT